MSTQAGARRTYRVVQWATGNVGLRSLRAVIEHPTLELVGLWVSSAEKEGRDAGELCGVEPVGVKATRKLEDILALKPDCVLYMPGHPTNFDEVCALLEAGINISTTKGEFHYPPAMDPAVRARVEAACRKGGASIHSDGSSPGFVNEAVPILLTSIARRLDCLTIDEYADISSRNSPEMLFGTMGFGKTPEEMAQRISTTPVRGVHPSMQLVADALSLTLDRVEIEGDFATAVEDTEIAAGLVKKGTVAATRRTVAGIANGKPVLRYRYNWYVTAKIDKAGWDLRETGWRIRVEGDTPLDVNVVFPVSAEDYAAFTPGLTAHRPVNAVRYVCEAAPGIVTTADLPQIAATLS